MRFFKEHGFPPSCPCGPWSHPKQWHYWEHFWDRLYHGKMKSPFLFCELVKPNQTLVFPYPSKGLPDNSVLHTCLGKIHANRQSQVPADLAKETNPPIATLLRVGKERYDVAAT